MGVMSQTGAQLQQNIIKHLGTKPLIDPEQEVESRVEFLADYLRKTGAKGFVLGISGGQDSTLAGRLAQLAVARVEETQFWAVRLPHGVQADEDDAQIALDFIQPDHRLTVNIAPATKELDDAVATALGNSDNGEFNLGDFNRGNVKARVRMTAQYAIAGEVGALVLGSDHAAENITAFFTKWGDGAADLLPLEGLNKRQGALLLQHLGAPESTWKKIPTADLEEDRPQLADEEALGVSYPHIDDYLEGKDVPAAARQRIEELWYRGAHKRIMPPGPHTLAR
ncbi:TPA: ammonia-dependent NAD(+) synthetase [Corynebacterium striatum]|uniref:ammonia-dependent NAD(+) synthetase n=1 Tax=Corynebacterium striatum TaxID=43770 RepID=UPI0006675C0A|nr:ammonia-dependent NAD(+) synthetase [Corynebacterium striatum]MDK8789110.1 ammonia-dependent NAD(+) synthetase [Corynebacterium striatum]HAT1213592.1 ammonia-dependent NAD(+) synthetase [Corynebacterium striatum]HAT1476372.1 ammonia-dependent NAD(+) synthetase [Corynebacterium striatum]HAT6526608.1 ammonia-dependent NAD(+) synthetase [Corynebacterium striatum]HAT6564742.1 ammonia-dependent NAD(+) synthetase [Corynebacterium striatum]